MTAITLPSLPIGKDYYYEVMSYDDIRTRDLEVARLVLEAACSRISKVHLAGIEQDTPDIFDYVRAIRDIEVKHHE